MNDAQATAYLRRRRATYFFGDWGPVLPKNMRARWRLFPSDPHGWHANMVGFVEGPAEGLGQVLDVATSWFTSYHVDTNVDADEYSPLFHQQQLLDERGLRLQNDWDAMICRAVVAPRPSPHVTLRWAEHDDEIRMAALIAEQDDQLGRPKTDPAAVARRTARYRQEHQSRQSRFVLAQLDGRTVGTARLTAEELPLILGVVTLPEARGNGVATAIVGMLAAGAIMRGGACALYVERDSQAARIYGRLGFEPLYRSRVWLRSYKPPAQA